MTYALDTSSFLDLLDIERNDKSLSSRAGGVSLTKTQKHRIEVEILEPRTRSFHTVFKKYPPKSTMQIVYVGISKRPPQERADEHARKVAGCKYLGKMYYHHTSNMKLAENQLIEECRKHKIDLSNDKNKDGSYRKSSAEESDGNVYMIVMDPNDLDKIKN